MITIWARVLCPMLLLASGTAMAQSPDPAAIVRGLCQKNGCAELAVLDKQPAGQGPDGQLFRTRVALFHADAGGRSNGGVEDGYIYCSRTRPAVISAAPGKPVTAFLLAPEDGRPSWQQRASVNFVAIYFTVCHGIEAGRAAARDRRGVAHALGYASGGESDRTVRLVDPRDILRNTPEG